MQLKSLLRPVLLPFLRVRGTNDITPRRDDSLLLKARPRVRHHKIGHERRFIH